jgi:hypothetical protein
MQFQVGDLVQYSRQFLQSTGQYTGPIPFAKGQIIDMKQLSGETTIATIKWQSPPELVGDYNRVNTKNLHLVGKPEAV